MTPTTKKEQAEAILRQFRQMRGTKAFGLFAAAIEEAAAMATRQIADPQVQDDNSIQFLRGVLWATQQFLKLPDSIEQNLTNDALLATAGIDVKEIDE